ncbi:thioredoxin family protein [Microbacterium sp. MM2322]|uniref:TlpA family protein disulfide reductase n=1 Tax=Microbacterium sp. MM2322 TaxID=3157631 RepID=UPI0032D59E34
MELLPAIVVLSALLALTVGVGLALGWRQNRPRAVDPREVIEPTRLGAERLGETATLLQFSTEMCSRCPGVHRTLREIADDREGVLHLNVDLTHRVDIAQHFRVLQTPTTLIIDQHGVVRSRFGGTPGRQVVEMELDRVTAGAGRG